MNKKGKIKIYITGLFVTIFLIFAAEAKAVQNGKIAFTSNRDGNEEIYVMNADGSNQTRLTNNQSNDNEPSFSPNGTNIAFTSDRDGYPEIYVMDADGSNQRRITFDRNAAFGAVWRPDGGKLAYIAYSVQINTINVDGSGRTTIYTVFDQNNNFLDMPDWSPDGTRIAVELYREGGFASDVVTMNPDGSGSSQITSAMFFEFNSRPAWSPDGTRIVFSHNNYDLVLDQDVLSLDITDPNGGNRLTVYGQTSFNPDWSPDSTKITFDDATFVNPGTDIFVMNENGSGLVNLTNSGAKDYDPSWGSIPSASVSVSGRVTTPDGRSLRNAVVILTDPLGVRRTATTSSFGIFMFDNVPVGENYAIGVSSKRYRFASRSLTVNDNLTNVDFVGLE